MKLYTEEQLHNTVIAVSNYLDDINLGRAQEKIEKHLKALQPIELPSDEEILKVALENTNNINEQILFNNGAIYICKLIEEQILNQNK